MLAEEVIKLQNKNKPPDLADIDTGLFNRIRIRFLRPHLKWEHQLALKLLWSSPGGALPPRDLCTRLENCGYPTDLARGIVRTVVDGSIIVDTNRHGDIDTVLNAADTEISIKSPEIARILGRLFMENPLL